MVITSPVATVWHTAVMEQGVAAMQKLFISYCRHDFDTANALADTLSKAGLSVWLDCQAIQEGAAFDTQIEEAIAQTRVVIVIWSEHSVKSHWVGAEAAHALGKHKLLPISIDQSEPPLQFMQIQTIDFRYWDRTSNHRAFQQLAGALAKRLEASAASTDAQPRFVSHTLAALSTGAVEHRAKTRLEHGLPRRVFASRKPSSRKSIRTISARRPSSSRSSPCCSRPRLT